MTTPYPALVLHSGADREQLKAVLINKLDSLLPQLFPEGRCEGHEFLVGDLQGSPGRSLRVELAGEKRGLWNDFESGEGGDVIDLWASKYGLDARRNFPEVLRQFKQEFGTFIQPQMRPSPSAPSAPAHGALGTPSDQWDYLDATGQVMVTMFRYDTPKGKSYRPWDHKTGRFASPDFRPLYNLPGIARVSQVVLVEGEKCAQALIDANVVATTTMHGAQSSSNKTDWSPMKGKQVIIWPDHDKPGEVYARAVAKACVAAGSASVVVLTPPADKPAKWDVVDAIAEGFDWRSFIAASPESRPPAPMSRIQHYTLGQLIDDTSPMPEDLVAPRLLTSGSLLVFGGAPKVGKSDFLLAFLAHMAAGMPFLGLVPARPLRVFYLQAEVGYYYLRERLKSIGLPFAAMELARVNLVVTPQVKFILDGEGVQEAAQAAREAFGVALPDIIAIDPLRNFFDGGTLGGENENTAMMYFLTQCLDRLRDAVNPAAAVVLVHHTRKLGKKQFDEDPFQALVGAGSLRSYYSAGMLLHRPDESMSPRQLIFELRNGPAIETKCVDKIDGRWKELESSARLVMQQYGAKLDAERMRKRDVILRLLLEESELGRCYNASQFGDAFEGKSGLASERAIRQRIKVLATKGYIKFFKNGKDYELPPMSRTNFGYMCVEGMCLRVTTPPNPQTGETTTKMIPVLPTHYRCPSGGTLLPVENPEVWVYPGESNEA